MFAEISLFRPFFHPSLVVAHPGHFFPLSITLASFVYSTNGLFCAFYMN